jgi:hypothetical protein
LKRSTIKGRRRQRGLVIVIPRQGFEHSKFARNSPRVALAYYHLTQ